MQSAVLLPPHSRWRHRAGIGDGAAGPLPGRSQALALRGHLSPAPRASLPGALLLTCGPASSPAPAHIISPRAAPSLEKGVTENIP